MSIMKLNIAPCGGCPTTVFYTFDILMRIPSINLFIVSLDCVSPNILRIDVLSSGDPYILI